MADKAGGKKRLLELGIVFSSDEESDNDDLPQQIADDGVNNESEKESDDDEDID
jgi:hypothetical protein